MKLLSLEFSNLSRTKNSDHRFFQLFLKELRSFSLNSFKKDDGEKLEISNLFIIDLINKNQYFSKRILNKIDKEWILKTSSEI